MDTNPQTVLSEYRFDNYKRVTVVNPRKEDYHFTVEGKPYSVKAGQKKRFPGYIATLYIKHMAKLVAQDENRIQRIIEPQILGEYYKKLIIDVEDLVDTHEVPAGEPGEEVGEPEKDPEEDDAFAGADDDEQDDAPIPDDDLKPIAGFGFGGHAYQAYESKSGLQQFTRDDEPIEPKVYQAAEKEAKNASKAPKPNSRTARDQETTA